MMHGLASARSLATAALALSLLVPTAALAQSASPSNGGPDQPVSATAEPLPPADGATPVVPEDGLLDVRTLGWDHITVAPDGRTLTVYFWSGVQDCYGLAGVTVDETGVVPVIQIQVGTRPGADACIDIAQAYSTIVVLGAPILGGGLV